MEDWQANGEKARALMRYLIELVEKKHSEVHDALAAYREGDPSRLVDCLLTLDHDLLAELAREDEYSPPKSREEIRVAACLARDLYDLWRIKNKREGVRDYGCHERMKGDAVTFVAEDFFWWFTERERLAVHDLMDRPPSRYRGTK